MSEKLEEYTLDLAVSMDGDIGLFISSKPEAENPLRLNIVLTPEEATDLAAQIHKTAGEGLLIKAQESEAVH